MEHLTQSRVIDAKITRHRVEPERGHSLDTRDGAWDLVEQGQHRAGIVRTPLRHPIGNDKTGGRFRRDPGLSTKWRGAIALAFEERSEGEVIGIDELKVLQSCGSAPLSQRKRNTKRSEKSNDDPSAARPLWPWNRYRPPWSGA